MLDFAFTSPKWDNNLQKGNHYLDDLWYRLMGLDGNLLHLWNEQNVIIVTQMQDYYERWAALHLFRGYHTSTFMAFLQTPAAQNILMDGLLWLDQAASETKTGFKYEQEALAGLLTFCWQNHRLVLRQHSQYWDAFMRLLNHLVRQGNNLALSLSELISSETTG
jgi:hypothetical protein